MSSRSFRSRFGKRRPKTGGRWAAILSALCLALLAPKMAQAAAPMCDPAGMSVVAPIPALPSITGEWTAQKSCESSLQDEMNVGSSHDDRPLAPTVPDVPERIVAAAPTLPRLAGRLVERPEAAFAPSLPGHARGVYRPPPRGLSAGGRASRSSAPREDAPVLAPRPENRPHLAVLLRSTRT